MSLLARISVLRWIAGAEMAVRVGGIPLLAAGVTSRLFGIPLSLDLLLLSFLLLAARDLVSLAARLLVERGVKALQEEAVEKLAEGVERLDAQRRTQTGAALFDLSKQDVRH